jgi:hypothetical protein
VEVTELGLWYVIPAQAEIRPTTNQTNGTNGNKLRATSLELRAGGEWLKSIAEERRLAMFAHTDLPLFLFNQLAESVRRAMFCIEVLL